MIIACEKCGTVQESTARLVQHMWEKHYLVVPARHYDSAERIRRAAPELLAACEEAIARIGDLSGWMSCECVACAQCGKAPRECTGTECAQTCGCSECDSCMATQSLGIIRAAIAKAYGTDGERVSTAHGASIVE